MIKTKDYQQFKTILSNREVDPKHVKKLIDSITESNMLHLNPIIVNKNKQVIDGQHRLEAASALGVDIYYIMDDHIDKSKISTLNTNQKNWTLYDYINFYTTEGNGHYKRLSRFINKYNFIKATDAAKLLSSKSSAISTIVKEGSFMVADESRAIKIAEDIKRLGDLNELALKRPFVSAYQRALKNELFDPEAFYENVSKQPRSIVACLNSGQASDIIEEIYNYYRRVKIRLK